MKGPFSETWLARSTCHHSRLRPARRAPVKNPELRHTGQELGFPNWLDKQKLERRLGRFCTERLSNGPMPLGSAARYLASQDQSRGLFCFHPLAKMSNFGRQPIVLPTVWRNSSAFLPFPLVHTVRATRTRHDRPRKVLTPAGQILAAALSAAVMLSSDTRPARPAELPTPLSSLPRLRRLASSQSLS